MDPRIAEWLASGDTGTSSKAIMLWLSARTTDKTWGASTPSDPSDLCRCLRLLDRIPEWRERMPEMAEAGGLWPTFAKRWAEMEASLLAECDGKVPEQYGRGWKCPKTYELMKAVHAEAYASDKPKFRETSLGNGITMRFGS